MLVSCRGERLGQELRLGPGAPDACAATRVRAPFGPRRRHDPPSRTHGVVPSDPPVGRDDGRPVLGEDSLDLPPPSGPEQPLSPTTEVKSDATDDRPVDRLDGDFRRGNGGLPEEVAGGSPARESYFARTHGQRCQRPGNVESQTDRAGTAGTPDKHGDLPIASLGHLPTMPRKRSPFPATKDTLLRWLPRQSGRRRG